jgi:hypothetical protein
VYYDKVFLRKSCVLVQCVGGAHSNSSLCSRSMDNPAIHVVECVFDLSRLPGLTPRMPT